ncbi:MAG: thioredoxin [Paramuribaculum sp.]|nr:thioredoxin [Paramuribaculum sp.]
MAIEFNDQTVSEAIQSGAAVVVDFWATWCGPCVGMSPIIEQLATQFEGKPVKIGKYNIDDNTDLATECRIMSIPAILFFKNGKQVKELRLAGSQSLATLTENVEKLLAL